MIIITIRETAGFGDNPNAAVSFDNQGAFKVEVRDPFSEE